MTDPKLECKSAPYCYYFNWEELEPHRNINNNKICIVSCRIYVLLLLIRSCQSFIYLLAKSNSPLCAY